MAIAQGPRLRNFRTRKNRLRCLRNMLTRAAPSLLNSPGRRRHPSLLQTNQNTNAPPTRLALRLFSYDDPIPNPLVAVCRHARHYRLPQSAFRGQSAWHVAPRSDRPCSRTGCYLPVQVAANHTTHKLYVLSGQAGPDTFPPPSGATYAIKILDTTTNTVSGGIDLGLYHYSGYDLAFQPFTLAVDESATPGGNKIYVLGFGGGDVVLRVIDCATETNETGQGTRYRPARNRWSELRLRPTRGQSRQPQSLLRYRRWKRRGD